MLDNVIVIPARYNSSRFPGKPLQLICGKPMLWWTYHQALKAKEIDKIIVATDSEKIVQCCEENDMNVMLTSDKHQTGTDRVAEVAEKIKANIYINVQGDEPLIEPKVIDTLVTFMRKNPEYICSTARSKIQNPVDVINTTISKVVVDVFGNMMYVSKNPIPYPKASINFEYYKALGIYAFRQQALEIYRTNPKATYENIEDIEMLRLVERGVKVFDIEVISNSPSVDTPKDLLRIEHIINQDEG